MPTRILPLADPFDLVATLGPLARGSGDRTIRLARTQAWRAYRTSDGPVTLAIAQTAGRLTAEAWGPGARSALDDLPRVLGLDGGPWRLADHHRLVSELARRQPGVRLTRTGAVLDALIPAILEQKVTGQEAHRAWRGLVSAYGEPAPGPTELRLHLPPAPERLAEVPYFRLHQLGVERRRAELIRRVASRVAWFEQITELSMGAAYARLTALPGIGPWTAAEVAVRALGDPDAVSVGDFHLPNLVAFALAGEPRADDARMLELLEPWRGERAKVVRLLELSGIHPPRYGPRLVPRRIEAL